MAPPLGSADMIAIGSEWNVRAIPHGMRCAELERDSSIFQLRDGVQISVASVALSGRAQGWCLSTAE